MKTCKSCKFWFTTEDDGSPYNYYGEHGRCLNEKVDGKLAVDNDALDSHADYNYGVSTGPDFGCIHHTDK